MRNRRFFVFAYAVPPRDDDHKALPHQVRDTSAAQELGTAFGGQYGGLIRNPISGESDTLLPLKSGDVLVVTTRPFLNDNASEDRNVKKAGRPTGWWLESDVYRTARRFFATCSRSRIELTGSLVRLLAPQLQLEARWDFSPFNALGRYRHAGAGTVQYGKTMLFLVYCPITLSKTVPGYPAVTCDLLLAFGVSGTATLLWTHLLRTEYWCKWGLDLDGPRFLMAELDLGAAPEDPVTMDFAKDWLLRPVANFSPEMDRLPIVRGMSGSLATG